MPTKLFVAAVILAVIALNSHFAAFLPAQIEGAPQTYSWGWFPALNLAHNAYYLWHNEPLTSALTWIIHGSDATLPARAHLALLFLGLVVLLQRISNSSSSFGPTVGAFAILLIIGSWQGFDRPLLASLGWFPWFAYYLSRTLENPQSRLDSALTLACGILLAFSANQLAPFFSVVASFLAFIVRKRNESIDQIPTTSTLFFCLAPSILVLSVIPSLELPDNPQLAHVVPYDGLPGMIRPLVGPHPDISVIDMHKIGELYASPVLLLFAVCLLTFALTAAAKGLSDRERKFFIAATVLSGLALLDSALPPEFALIAPFAAWRRLIPYSFYLPLTGAALSLATLCYFSAMVNSRSPWRLSSALLVLLLIPLTWNPSYSWDFPLVQSKKSRFAWENGRGLGPNGTIAARERLLISPSYALINSNGLWVISESERIRSSHFRALNLAEVSISASHKQNSQELSRLTDHGNHRRWSARRGSQKGDEWLHLAFREVQLISGIELDTGNFATDFPRGIRISYAEMCLDKEVRNILDTAHYEVIFEQPSWQGEIRYSGAGFPYYGPQYSVKIHFPRLISAKCLMLQQTASHPAFDWSVTEIRLAQFPSHRTG